MALSYGQLGMLAQDGGDYDEAEAGYRQSLEIQRAPGQPGRGIASSYSQLGILVAERAQKLPRSSGT